MSNGEDDIADLHYRLEQIERQQVANTQDIDNLKLQSPDKLDKLEKLEKIAKNNRALIVLAVVTAPLIMGILLYDFSAEFKEGQFSGSVRSRNITFPEQAKTISVILGIGGLLGLSKDELIALISQKKD